MWAARNLKFLPVALAAAVRETPEMAAAADVTVRTLDGRRCRLVDLDAWGLVNLPVDEAIGLAPRITKTAGVSAETIQAALAGRSVQELGLLEFYRRYLPNQPTPVLMAPATAHYSWPKGAALLDSAATRCGRSTSTSTGEWTRWRCAVRSSAVSPRSGRCCRWSR